MTLSPTSGIIRPLDVTIANGASLSGSTNLAGHILCGFYMPSAWTAASITLQASYDGTNFSDVYYDGSEVSITASASQYISLDPQRYFGIQQIRVRSGTSSSAVNQAAERVIKLMVGKPAD